ncbi:hypothetical protein DPMN_160619 [Dreissena polymorpha]|uniref:Uncharacterized protein n=1 Tax=Dreissena polymorpha TaxID=45954 RepID=A0A9D4ERG1_DREPO|nr:hypothetical protein DPMN_160619 [Dreissena polymorpha]
MLSEIIVFFKSNATGTRKLSYKRTACNSGVDLTEMEDMESDTIEMQSVGVSVEDYEMEFDDDDSVISERRKKNNSIVLHGGGN